MASLSLPSSSCSAGVYVDVGMDRSNKDVYDVLDAYSQTKMPQGPHKVGGIATEAPLESMIMGHTSACHFSQRESETTLAGIKEIDTYV